MDMGAVRVESPAVSLVIILIDFRLGDQVDHIKAKAPDALLLPEKDHLLKRFPHPRIFPIQVCLCHIKKVQIPFAKLRHILPGRTAEFGLPVGGRPIRRLPLSRISSSMSAMVPNRGSIAQ